ncbi:zinc finger protein 267-like [Anopheles coustani]|uniref:zinc finger protein 267-like n=1 Tax=Anopheles coustani TaxID=139045 RepID=UPI002658B9FA|nr:zinc finger protein 267-like [Anopheles coustani]
MKIFGSRISICVLLEEYSLLAITFSYRITKWEETNQNDIFNNAAKVHTTTLNEDDGYPALCPMESYLTTSHQAILQRFCRLCMREYPFLFPFKAMLSEISIATMLERILGSFKIKQTPDLPNAVCSRCLTKLDFAYHVQKEFVHNEHRLRHYMQHGELIEKLYEFQKQSTIVRKSTSDQALAKHGDGLLQEAVHMDPAHEVPGMNDAAAEAAKIFKTMTPPGGWAVVACDCGQKSEASCQETHTANAKVKRKQRNRQILRQAIAAENPTAAKAQPISQTKCYICGCETESETALNDHTAQHVDMLPYSCPNCYNDSAEETKTITSLAMLQRHFRMHTYPLKCPHCPQRFRKYTTVYAHVRYRHEMFDNPEGYTCEICGIRIKYRPTFLFHMQNHRNEEKGTYKCQYCHRAFGTRARMERHVRSHTGERPFACRLCPKTFAYAGQLSAHMSRHNNERGHQCEQCGKGFFNKAMLGQHLATHEPTANRKVPHGKATRQRPCSFPDCKYVAQTYQAYYIHRLRHQMAHSCDECGRRFARQSEVRRHRRIYHTTDHPFKCEPCNKIFLSAQSYREHMDAHANVRRYECDVCDKKFVRRRNLTTHRLSHTNHRAHRCELCESTFKYKSDFNRHKKDKHGQTGHDECTTVQAEDDEIVKEIVLLPEDPMMEGILVEEAVQQGILVEEDIELDGTYGEIIETVEESNSFNIEEVVKEEYILHYA